MKKLTYEYIKERIEKTGYKLLSEKYENAHTKLEVQCPKEHIYKVRWCNFKRGDRCPICGNKKGKLVYDYVKTFIELKRYRLLSKEYKNSRTKLQMRCPKGHKFKMTWHNFQQGTRCPICNDQRFTYKYIKKEIKKKRYKLLDKKYVNNYTKLKLQCLEGHVFRMSWRHFKRGEKCPICRRNERKHKYKDIKNFIELKGYELLSKEYKNGHAKLELKCPKGHEFKMRWNNFQQKQRCPICQANLFTSKAEKEIANIIGVQDIKVERNDRTQIINPLTNMKLELDIWMPELNKAIEFNGIYWHSFKDKIIKDKIKLQECTKRNIKLLVIKEQDWIDNKMDCISKIKNFVKDKTMLSH